ncbi:MULTISPECIES: acyl-CoA dehydrogenase family protein [Streptomyces]|uniref:Acyl-CoA dehydrogenase family protein n=1 Tax=Streptomyces solicathayae TaxID=3081768 RepID=A0ABZ0LWC2_9ACTN|nr:acyl-CoA dehydrogenase family protein [Streptomyces sp. HUAS YS2]WOX23787.1 acyl-CoA dehydrogenase family protein [Streptomyces sp. HUAS YS2]
MDAAFTDEQEEIRRTLRELLAKRSGPDEVRAAVATAAGHDPELWTQLAERLGLPGLALPEEYGGVGCGPAELALACEETGRALAPSPLLATAVLAAPLIAALGTEPQRAELLPEIAAGTLTAALAVPGGSLAVALGLTGEGAEAHWSGDGRAGGVQARPVRDGWTLYGEAGQVLDGHSADLLLVAAHTGGFARSRTLLFLVRADADGLTRTRRTSLDDTRPQATVELRDVPAELLGTDPADVAGALTAAGRTAAAVVAAEAVGAAAHCLDRTVEHVRAREQFGRPVGSFQAVKHRLADLYVQLQAARSAACYAAWDAGRPGPGEPGAAQLALAQCLETARAVTGETIQLHGGIGFTWEHEAHLYFKRASADELLFGPVHRLRAAAAQATGLLAPHGTGKGAAA